MSSFRLYTTSSGALLGAVAFAVGHHFFYRSLEGHPPPDTSNKFLGYIQSVSGQQINIAVGTLLAFLVKSLLTIAVSRAQDQSCWRAIKHHPTELGLIDSLFSTQSNVFHLFNLRLWCRFPLAMVLVFWCWLLPFAAIISPATLNIEPALVINSTVMYTPIVQYGNGAFADAVAEDKDTDTGGSLNYDSPLAPVRRAVTQSLLEAGVLSLAAPFPNSSYHIDFYGPALKCTEFDRTSEVWKNQSAQIFKMSRKYPNDIMATCYYYLSWPGNAYSTPWSGSDWDMTFDITTGLLGSDSSFTVVAVSHADECDYGSAPDINLVQCDLWNASYAADFTYNNGVRDVSSSITSYESFFEWTATAFTSNAYPGMDEPSNYLLLWSYMSVMDSFRDYTVGSINQDPSQLDTTMFVNTKMIDTILPDTPQLNSLHRAIQGLSTGNTTNLSIKDALEEMFRNATLSLASQELLLLSYPLNDTNVTAYTYENVYTYSASILWVAYGVGIGVAALSIVIGCAIAAFAGGAYSTNFSTILRVAYNLRLSDDLDIADTSGKDPLPKRLEKTIVSLPPDGVFAIYTDPGQYIGPSDGQVTEIIVHGKPGTSTASEEQVSSHSAQPAPAYDPPMDNMGQTGHEHHQTQ